MSVMNFCHQLKKQIPLCYHTTKFLNREYRNPTNTKYSIILFFLFMKNLSSRVENRQAVQHVLKQKLLQTLAIRVENIQYLGRTVITSGLLRSGAITRLLRKESPSKLHTKASRHSLGARQSILDIPETLGFRYFGILRCVLSQKNVIIG